MTIHIRLTILRKNGLESLRHSLDLEISRAKSKDKQNGIGCH